MPIILWGLVLKINDFYYYYKDTNLFCGYPVVRRTVLNVHACTAVCVPLAYKAAAADQKPVAYNAVCADDGNDDSKAYGYKSRHERVRVWRRRTKILWNMFLGRKKKIADIGLTTTTSTV